MAVSVEQMYREWLKGDSLRTIGRRHSLGRMAVFGRFIKEYGQDCCNLHKQSLARVIYKEYGDLSLAMKARGIEGLYRTAKTENSYSRNQTTDLSTYHIALPEDDEPDRPVYSTPYLRLRYYILVAKVSLEAITDAIDYLSSEIEIDEVA